MTDEEAKKEHDEIQAEIAKEKGIKIDEPAEEEKPDDKEEEEPAAEDKDDETKSEKEEEEIADEVDTDEEDGEEKPDPIRKPRTLLAKLQETKRAAREAEEAKDKKIAELQAIVDEGKTAKAMETEIKEYAEKYGMPEEQVRDQFAILTKAFGKSAKPETNPTLEKASVLIQKQEAKEAFDAEFSDLVGEFPETKDLRAKIQAEAYKPENLNKSLYEIYNRHVKPAVVVKKKTGEGARGGGGRSGDSAAGGEPDFAKIAENVKNNVPGALKDLSGEQQDKLFDWMSKQGSRYK